MNSNIYELNAEIQTPKLRVKHSFPNYKASQGLRRASFSKLLLRIAAVGLASFSVTATTLQAGELFFDTGLLHSGDDAVLSTPVATFDRELERLQLTPNRSFAIIATNGEAQEASDAEMADLGEALKKAKVGLVEAAPILEGHQANRQKLREYAEQCEAWESDRWMYSEATSASKRGQHPVLPTFNEVPGLPGEFADYLEGAAAFRESNTNSLCRFAWGRLLQRPVAERKYKSTWAAFMLGKSWEKEDDDKAVEYFKMTRELAKQRFADSIGLAVAAVGLEARVELRRKHYARAMGLYLDQFAAGDHSADVSLRWTAKQAFKEGGEQLRMLATNANTRWVVTAYMISYAPYDYEWSSSSMTNSTSIWFAAMEDAGVRDEALAERLALAAYQANEFQTAQSWVNRAHGTPFSQWIQAKLLLRLGKTEAAMALQTKLTNLLPMDVEPTNSNEFADSLSTGFASTRLYFNSAARGQILGELGVLRLCKGQYIPALDAFLRAGFWRDAAYVAERVLTADELKNYVDQSWPLLSSELKTEQERSEFEKSQSPDQIRENIRYLLARRLTRELRGGEARPYFPAQWQSSLDSFNAALNAGWNETSSPDQRAKALFNAAIIARTNGMELLGTELQPDWKINDGSYQSSQTWERRATNSMEAKINIASEEELHRAAEHHASPEQRFHYRYQAASMAWEATKLMPDSEEMAQALWTAGSWLKYRDPATANIFYKELVQRGGMTALGAEAKYQHWFPRIDDQGNIISKPRAATEVLPSSTEEPVSPSNLDVGPAKGETEWGQDRLGYEFVIEPGDSLAAIVQAFREKGVVISMDDLIAANPGLNPESLEPGQKLFIPLTQGR